MTIDVSQFRLKPGYFLNADDSPATILANFSPQSSGIMLLDANQAKDWLAVTTELAADELGIYVVGPCQVPPRFQTLQTHAVALNSRGQEVLLNGTLVQLGGKNLKTVASYDPVSGCEVALNKYRVAAVTMWKEDFDDKTWQRILDHPVKTAQQLFAEDGFGDLMKKPWSRSYHHLGKPCQPEHSSSVQFHAEFDECPKLHSLLARSGFSRVYITPKGTDGKLDAQYKVLWLSDLSVKQIEARTSSLGGAAGLVKGKNGKYGLRLELTCFGQAWDRLKPGQPAPDTRIFDRMYRVHPLPLGLDAKKVEAWASHLKWEVRALKAVGAKVWLVSSNQTPPNIVTFNTQPVLVQEIPQKGVKQPGVIAAGPRGSMHSTTSHVDGSALEPVAAPTIFKTGDPYYDPWKTFTPTTGTDDSPHMTDVSSATPPQTRQVQGPIAERMQLQDSRIQAVEQALANLQEQNTQQHQHTDTRIATLTNHLQHHVQTTQEHFDHLHTENQQLSRTIADAMQAQEQRMAASFDELRNLLLRPRGTKRADPQSDEELLPAPSE
eukprot:Skav200258  [mRNA]  locus=scaffold128:283007:284653:+ [translate_table: standard]